MAVPVYIIYIPNCVPQTSQILTVSYVVLDQLSPPVHVITARKDFSGRYCFALRLFFFFFSCFFFMFAVALSLESLDGSQPNCHTRWRGRLARTLLKMAVIA